MYKVLKRKKGAKVGVITKKAHRDMSRLWDGAARAFLEAMIESNLPKVDTGMSRASLLPLARYLRIYGMIKGSIGNPKPKKGAFDMSGTWHPNWVRGIQLGQELGSEKHGFNLLYGGPKRMVFQFTFNITVWQYFVHEYGLYGEEVWNSIQIGKEAFDLYLHNNWDKYLDLDINKWVL